LLVTAERNFSFTVASFLFMPRSLPRRIRQDGLDHLTERRIAKVHASLQGLREVAE
jgi:hypothetical protein